MARTTEGPMNPITLRGLDHVVLRVRDLEASLRFYRGVLGCPVERRSDAIGLIQLRAGSGLIDLVPLDSPLGKAGGKGPSDQGRNVDHFALALDEFDEPALRTHLTAHGIAPGKIEQRYGAGGMGPSMYIRDPPDGYRTLAGDTATSQAGSRLAKRSITVFPPARSNLMRSF